MSYPDEPISAELNAMIPDGAILMSVAYLDELQSKLDRLAAQNAALRKLVERSKSLLPNWVIPSFNADLRRALTPAAQENATRKESEL